MRPHTFHAMPGRDSGTKLFSPQAVTVSETKFEGVFERPVVIQCAQGVSTENQDGTRSTY